MITTYRSYLMVLNTTLYEIGSQKIKVLLMSIKESDCLNTLISLNSTFKQWFHFSNIKLSGHKLSTVKLATFFDNYIPMKGLGLTDVVTSVDTVEESFSTGFGLGLGFGSVRMFSETLITSLSLDF